MRQGGWGKLVLSLPLSLDDLGERTVKSSHGFIFCEDQGNCTTSFTGQGQYQEPGIWFESLFWFSYSVQKASVAEMFAGFISVTVLNAMDKTERQLFGARLRDCMYRLSSVTLFSSWRKWKQTKLATRERGFCFSFGYMALCPLWVEHYIGHLEIIAGSIVFFFCCFL